MLLSTHIEWDFLSRCSTYKMVPVDLLGSYVIKFHFFSSLDKGQDKCHLENVQYGA